MERWTGVLRIHLDHNKSGPLFKIAASLCVSSSSKTLAVPSANAVFFNGDRVEGTGNEVIDELSDSKNIAEVLVSKLGGSVNAWVVDASTFNGPFAVYREFVPSVDSWGNPRVYNPEKFPASTSIIALLSKCAEQEISSITEASWALFDKLSRMSGNLNNLEFTDLDFLEYSSRRTFGLLALQSSLVLAKRAYFLHIISAIVLTKLVQMTLASALPDLHSNNFHVTRRLLVCSWYGQTAGVGFALTLCHGYYSASLVGPSGSSSSSDIAGGKLAESPSVRLPSTASCSSAPRTVILGFSKGGIVLNQMITELAHLKPKSARTLVADKEPSPVGFSKIQDQIIPTSVESFLDSISVFHYVDVGLNCAGAYITDHTWFKDIALRSLADNVSISFKLHGTPRQWCDSNRPWIRKERDRCLQLLEAEACRSNGKLLVTEKLYFPGMPPSLQMHFEIIKMMDLN